MNTNGIVDENGNLITIRNSPDVYVCIDSDENNRTFYIPISMPRRMPSLDFNTQKPTSELFDYINECIIRLSKQNIENWQRAHLSKLCDKVNLSKTEDLLKRLLLNNEVCYKCYNKEISNPNPQKNIQSLRDKGYIICTLQKYCEKCNEKVTTYSLTPVISCLNQEYETIPEALKKRICELLDFRDSYTGIENREISSHIPDHKFPEDRWDENTPETTINMTDDEIKSKFQLLSVQTNLQKQRSCGKCLKTKKRGYPFGVKFYYAGSEDWDSNIPEKGKEAEKGCVGCGWYDLLKWKEELNLFIRSKNQE